LNNLKKYITMNDLSNYRKSYDKSELLESSTRTIQLATWFEVEDFGGDA
jgi:pyridoxamine 5'-phosphate oxidase